MDKRSELEAFVAVVQQGGFSAAGRKLGLTPSALSKQLSRIEERLGVSLLNRNTRGVQLTDAGRAYYEGGRSIVEQLHRLETEVGEYRAGLKGLVRVSMPPGLLRHQVNDMLRDFYRDHPEIRLVFRATDRYVDLIEEGFDVAVRVGDLADSSLIVRRIARFSRLVVANPAYLQEHGAPREPRDLLRHNCLTLGVNRRSMNRWEFIGPAGPEVIEVSGNLEANTVEALHDAAEAGLGIARVSPLLVGSSLTEGRLVSLLADYLPAAASTLQIVYPSARYLSGAVRAFIDALAAYLAEVSRACGADVVAL